MVVKMWKMGGFLALLAVIASALLRVFVSGTCVYGGKPEQSQRKTVFFIKAINHPSSLSTARICWIKEGFNTNTNVDKWLKRMNQPRWGAINKINHAFWRFYTNPMHRRRKKKLDNKALHVKRMRNSNCLRQWKSAQSNDDPAETAVSHLYKPCAKYDTPANKSWQMVSI